MNKQDTLSDLIEDWFCEEREKNKNHVDIRSDNLSEVEMYGFFNFDTLVKMICEQIQGD